jgi:hypothetical protein
MTTGSVVQQSYIANFTDEEYNVPGPLMYASAMVICEDDVPPEYDYHSGRSSDSRGNRIVTELCQVSSDLRKLPKSAFQRLHGTQGWYWQVDYHLGITFGPELIFKFLYQGKVIGSANARYS